MYITTRAPALHKMKFLFQIYFLSQLVLFRILVLLTKECFTCIFYHFVWANIEIEICCCFVPREIVRILIQISFVMEQTLSLSHFEINQTQAQLLSFNRFRLCYMIAPLSLIHLVIITFQLFFLRKM